MSPFSAVIGTTLVRSIEALKPQAVERDIVADVLPRTWMIATLRGCRSHRRVLALRFGHAAGGGAFWRAMRIGRPLATRHVAAGARSSVLDEGRRGARDLLLLLDCLLFLRRVLWLLLAFFRWLMRHRPLL